MASSPNHPTSETASSGKRHGHHHGHGHHKGDRHHDKGEHKEETKITSQSWNVLIASTLAFTVCFMIWMMFAAIGIPLRKDLNLSQSDFATLIAMPVLSGSLVRIPLGIWTDKYGGRIVMTALLAIAVPTTWCIAYATEYWQFIVIGLLMGLAGGSFSVGTPYVSRWFPQRWKGTAMGVFGAGNSGAAVNKILAPMLIAAAGGAAVAGSWKIVPHVYSVIMLGTVVVFWLLSASNPKHLVPSTTHWTEQIKVMVDMRVVKYCLYYFFVFGGYVGLSLWLLQYYQGEYDLDMVQAGFLTACFALPGGVVRAIGGYISDKFGAHRVTFWVMVVSLFCLIVLSIPGPKTLGSSGLNIYAFTAMLFLLGVVVAVGKASVFKYIGDEYTHNVGAVSGAVGLWGGLGGFLFPKGFGILQDIFHVRSTAFMLMLVVVILSLIWMYYTEIRPRRN
ncbi:MAG: NarK/NasA family nitrate transporter [Burkholderiales bacterium]|jgi:NNP family nitrate/nitrite transporter-like MFS transporter|nr:NarK/NasA family nitrate transporter [Burkholderiales bacterium]